MPSNNYQRYVSNEQQKRRNKRIIFQTLLSAVMIILAMILSIYRNELIEKMVLKSIKFELGSDSYNNWLHPPISTTRSYYLFNIINPIDIVTGPSSTIIKCNDTPAYSYNIKTTKIDVQWLNNNKEISYGVERLFTRDPERFDPESVNDTGVFVDLLRATFRTQFPPKPTPAFYALGGNNLFYRRNAIEQLEGFTSDLFNTVKEKMHGPNTDKSGFVYRHNGSRLYNVSIQTDLMKKGQVLTFDSELSPYSIKSPSDYPFPIYDGLTFPPMLFNKPILNIFHSDFCLPFVIEYKRSLTMFDGINMHEYKVKLIDFTNCTNPGDTQTCNEVDKLDISKCISESLPNNTLFLSKAYFYGSNNETIKEMKIEDFPSTSDKHDSVLYFEPYTGTPFKASFRIQLNVEAIVDPMIQSEYGSELEPTNKKKGVKRLIPIFWIDQEIKISEKIIDQIRTKIPKLFFLRQYGHYIIISSAIVLAIIIVLIMEVMARCADKNDHYKRGGYIKTEGFVQH